jgi:hypothetical protein
MKKATIFQKVFLALFLGGVVFSLLNTLPSCTVGSHLPRPLLIEKYGPLVKDPAGVFDLPEGFTYKVISQTGDLMSDGLLVPDRPGRDGHIRGKPGSGYPDPQPRTDAESPWSFWNRRRPGS